MNLYEACLTLLQVYSKNNLGRQRIDVTAEEDQYQDLLLIMELLTNLLSKEFIDFSDTGIKELVIDEPHCFLNCKNHFGACVHVK